jgi:hypothetical protein
MHSFPDSSYMEASCTFCEPWIISRRMMWEAVAAPDWECMDDCVCQGHSKLLIGAGNLFGAKPLEKTRRALQVLLHAVHHAINARSESDHSHLQLSIGAGSGWSRFKWSALDRHVHQAIASGVDPARVAQVLSELHLHERKHGWMSLLRTVVGDANVTATRWLLNQRACPNLGFFSAGEVLDTVLGDTSRKCRNGKDMEACMKQLCLAGGLRSAESCATSLVEWEQFHGSVLRRVWMHCVARKQLA